MAAAADNSIFVLIFVFSFTVCATNISEYKEAVNTFFNFFEQF